MNCSTIKFICFPQSQLRQSGHKLLIQSLFILFQTQIKQASNQTSLLLLHSQYLSNNMSPMDAINPSGYNHLILMVMIICSIATIPMPLFFVFCLHSDNLQTLQHTINVLQLMSRMHTAWQVAWTCMNRPAMSTSSSPVIYPNKWSFEVYKQNEAVCKELEGLHRCWCCLLQVSIEFEGLHSGLHKVHRVTGYVINLIGRNCNAHLCLDRVLMLLCKLCSYVQCFSDGMY